MLDLKIFEEARILTNLEEPIVFDFVDPRIVERYDSAPWVKRRDTYQFRYVVHRQNRGFFTPVVFDVEFSYAEGSNTDRTTMGKLNTIAEPFIEGALFMNHTSEFIVDMLKGQEAGFNRKELLESIRNPIDGTADIWYSDWQVPPVTRQSQRIVIYDMDQIGSMLDPINVVKQIPRLVDEEIGVGSFRIYQAKIVAGYTQKTV